MSKSPFCKNYWKEVRLWRAELTANNAYEFPVKQSLETSWNILSGEVYTMNYDGTLHSVLSREDDEKTASTPLDAFIYYIDSGFYPPPEILLWLKECFTYYFECNGRASLEHIFFGRETPAIGNESARRASDHMYNLFTAMVGFEKLGARKNNRNTKTQLQLAEEFLAGDYTFCKLNLPEKLKSTDPETFLRNWRRKVKRATDK